MAYTNGIEEMVSFLQAPKFPAEGSMTGIHMRHNPFSCSRSFEQQKNVNMMLRERTKILQDQSRILRQRLIEEQDKLREDLEELNHLRETTSGLQIKIFDDELDIPINDSKSIANYILSSPSAEEISEKKVTIENIDDEDIKTEIFEEGDEKDELGEKCTDLVKYEGKKIAKELAEEARPSRVSLQNYHQQLLDVESLCGEQFARVKQNLYTVMPDYQTWNDIKKARLKSRINSDSGAFATRQDSLYSMSQVADRETQSTSVLETSDKESSEKVTCLKRNKKLEKCALGLPIDDKLSKTMFWVHSEGQAV